MQTVYAAVYDVRNQGSDFCLFWTREDAITQVMDWIADADLEREGFTLEEARAQLDTEGWLHLEHREDYYRVSDYRLPAKPDSSPVGAPK